MPEYFIILNKACPQGKLVNQNLICWDFPGGEDCAPLVKTVLPMQGFGIQSMVGTLDPTCCN